MQLLQNTKGTRPSSHAARPTRPLTGLGQLKLTTKQLYANERQRCSAASQDATDTIDQQRQQRDFTRPEAWRDTGVTKAPPAGQQLGTVERSRFVMEETRTFLAQDLTRIFETGEITQSRYSPNIRFEDPISSFNDLNGYMLNIRMLKALFSIQWTLHTIEVTGTDEITARWTMGMQFWLLPWKPNLTFTGRTFYKVDLDTGMILSHTDVWDALEHNQFLSLEAVQHVLKMFLQVQLTPSIESHKYTVLKKYKDYEIRSYPSYLVAETSQPMGSGPASGSGFGELAQYIFGGNREQMKMEMTTPVLSTVKPEGNQSTRMQFVMESRFSDVTQLPTPVDMKVVKKEEQGGYFGSISFAGWPLDFEVVQNERALRDAMLRDGLRPKPGYTLARYNDPSVLPAVRRNEVLIELEGFQWPPQE